MPPHGNQSRQWLEDLLARPQVARRRHLPRVLARPGQAQDGAARDALVLGAHAIVPTGAPRPASPQANARVRDASNHNAAG